MKKLMYFRLQLKRFLNGLPWVLLTSFSFILCFCLVFSSVLENEETKKARVEVGIVGDGDDTYLAMGMAALKNFDSSRLAINLSFMNEDEAKLYLEKGNISAYIVIPDDFVMNAYHGKVGKLTYVTAPDAVDLTDFIKDEVLDVISVLLVESQRGVYAAGNLADDLVDGMSYSDVANDAALEYVDLILSRSKMYEVEILGAADGIGLVPLLFCSGIVSFIFLFGIGFSAVFAGKRQEISSLLASVRIGSACQVLGEYFAFGIISSAAILLLLGGVDMVFGERIENIIGFPIGYDFIFASAFSCFMICAMQMLVFELTNGIVSGVLGQFFTAIFVLYFSGCLYPIYFFPTAVQRIAPYLPAGCVRAFVTAVLSGGDIMKCLLVILFYTFLFLLFCIFIRRKRIVGKDDNGI